MEIDVCNKVTSNKVTKSETSQGNHFRNLIAA